MIRYCFYRTIEIKLYFREFNKKKEEEEKLNNKDKIPE